jgi:hypothetical protein
MERRIQGEAVGVYRHPRSNATSRRRRTRCLVMNGLVRTTTVMSVRTTPVETVGADHCLALLPVREAPLPTSRRWRIWTRTITPIGHSQGPRWDGHDYIDASTVVTSREKHERNEGEDGDQGASPPAIFLFKTFDTSLDRFRGPQTSSAGCFLRHDFTSLAGPRRGSNRNLPQPVCFFRQRKLVFGTNVVTERTVEGQRPPFTCEVLWPNSRAQRI